MNLGRFFTLGMEDADRRLAAALEPRPLDAADRYLESSAFVGAIDRATRRLGEWWLASQAGRALTTITRNFSSEPRQSQYQAIGVCLLAAVAAHVVLTLSNGPRPGWFWAVIPAMVATFAALLVAGSRSSRSTH